MSGAILSSVLWGHSQQWLWEYVVLGLNLGYLANLLAWSSPVSYLSGLKGKRERKEVTSDSNQCAGKGGGKECRQRSAVGSVERMKAAKSTCSDSNLTDGSVWRA